MKKKTPKTPDITLFDIYAAHAIGPVSAVMEEAPDIAEAAWEIAFEMCRRRRKWVQVLKRHTESIG